MRTSAQRLRADDRAQDLAEYGIALTVIGVVAVSVALMIGTKVGAIWEPVDSVVSVVHGQGHGNNGNHGNGNNGNGNGNSGNNGNGNGHS